MNYRRLGRTNLAISHIAYGGLALFYVRPREARALLNAALDRGINYVDCDEAGNQFVSGKVYEDTREKLGKVLKSRRSEVYVGIKCMFASGEEVARDIDRALEYVFKGTGREVIDLFHLAHVDTDEKLDRLLAADGGLEAIDAARKAGKIDHVLVASHNPTVLLRALKTGCFDVAEFPYTVIEREYEHEVIPFCREHDIGSIVMKPIGGGQMAACADLSLRWIAHKPVDVIIPGMKTMDELQSNIASVEEKAPLCEDELRQLETMGKTIGSEYCHRCGYCLPCPQGIHIIGMFDVFRSTLVPPERKKEIYRQVKQRGSSTADDCIACGQCVEKCPFKLPVPELMQKISAALSG